MVNNKMDIKGWKFWPLLVVVQIIVVMCLSTTYAGEEKSSNGTQGLQQGLIYVKLNRHTEAIAEFKKELEKSPDNPDAYYHLGNSFIKLKEYDKAKNAINSALKLKPDFSEARYLLSVISMTRADELRKLGESESVVLEKLLEAEDLCRELIDQDQSFIKSYSLLGQIHILQGFIDDAITDYKHLLDVDHTSVSARVVLARLYLNKGNLDLAEKECDLVLSEFEPGNFTALFILSTIYEKSGKYDEAIVLLKQILEKTPENTGAHIQLGLLYLKLSKYDEALEEAEYVSKDRTTAQPSAIYFIKGSVFLQRRDYEAAVTNLKEAILRLPDMVESHYFLAHALSGLGRTHEAINEFKATLRLGPEFIPAKLDLVMLLTRIGGWQKESIALCKDILDIKPDHIETLQLLGIEYVKMREFEDAEIQFRKILEINSSVGEINMAYLSLVSGQLSKCIRQCEAIISTNPNEIRAFDILGLAHIRRGDFEEGIEQLKKVIEINPKSTSTLINIAKAYVVTEKNSEAIEALKNTINIDPKNLQSRVLLAGIYRKEGSIDEVAKLLEQVIEINPERLEGYALASIYLLQGKVDMSIDLCNKAIKLFPDNAGLYTNLAISYQQKGNYIAATKYGKQLIGLKPEGSSFMIVLLNNYAASGEYSLANEQIEKISSFTLDQKKAYHELLGLCQSNSEKGKQITLALNRSIFARQAGFIEFAISESKKAVEIFPKNIVAKVILANNYLSVNRNEDAIAIYTEIIKDKPEFASSYYDLGRAYLQADKKDDAISTYQDLIGVDSQSVSGRLALAALLVKQGESDKAAKMIEGVIELDSNNVMAHGLMGKVSLSENNYDRAETEFSKMIELDRDSFEGHFNMARLKFTQGDIDSCVEHCRSALEAKPLDVRVLNILGMAYLKKGLINDAVLEFNKIIDINSDYIPAYLNLAKINIAGKRPVVAALLYKAALKVAPDAVEPRLGLGNSYLLMGKYPESIAEFESVIKEYPKNTNAYFSLSRAYLASDNSDRALETIMYVLSIEPEDPMARYVLAEIYAKKDDIQQAVLQLKRVLPGNSKMLMLYKLGVFYIDLEDYDNAILTYKQGVENFPESYLLWCNLAVAYHMNKDFDSARDACSKAIEIKPDGIVPKLCMVYVSLANGEYEGARSHLEGMEGIRDVQKEMYLDLLELCEQNSEVADKVSKYLARTLVYTNYKWYNRILRECDEMTKIVPANAVAYNVQLDTLTLTREVDKAIEVCKKIIELEPENPDFYNRLADIYHRKGEIDEALVQCRKVVGFAPDNVAAYMGIGVLLESKGLLEESVDAYKRVIELDPTSPKAYNNLAWLYASKMKSKIDEAKKLAERAKELSPNDPDINDTLGWIYYMDAEYDKAVSLLKVAVGDAIWNPTIHYHLGMAYFKKGLQEEALAELQRAFKISNIFPEAEEAKGVMEKITRRMINDTDNSFQNQESSVSVSE